MLNTIPTPPTVRILITYSPDITKLMPEVLVKLPDYVIRAEPTAAQVKAKQFGTPVSFDIVKTPTVRKGNKTLSLVRCTSDEVKLLAALKSIRVLSNIPAVDRLTSDQRSDLLLNTMTKTGRALYDSVHDQTPVVTTMPDGTTHTHTPSPHIGSFAGDYATLPPLPVDPVVTP